MPGKTYTTHDRTLAITWTRERVPIEEQARRLGRSVTGFRRVLLPWLQEAGLCEPGKHVFTRRYRMPHCTMRDCTRAVWSRDLCRMHYDAWWRLRKLRRGR